MVLKKERGELLHFLYFSFALGERAQEGASAPCSSSICGVWKLALIVAGTFNLLAAAAWMDGKKPGIETIFLLQYIWRGTHGFPAQQSNLWWIQVSVSESLGHAVNTGPSRWFQRFLHHQRVRVFQVEFPALWLEAYPNLLVIHNRGNPTTHK